MRGYHNRPEETEQIMRGGWLHTGDIGYLDDDGFLFVVDRKKDMIIRGGENIYPAELEAVLHDHPAVAEAAVVGVPDPVYGENVVAFVVVKPGAQVSESELIEHVCQQVARFKAPSQVFFLPALPKSNIGKILQKKNVAFWFDFMTTHWRREAGGYENREIGSRAIFSRVLSRFWRILAPPTLAQSTHLSPLPGAAKGALAPR